jgi:predicted N-acetyltransferase YhbS
MDVTLRPGRPEDATTCGAICYEAFKAIASQHNFPPDFSSREVAVDLLSLWLSHPGFYTVVAEAEGRIMGSNVLDERSTIAGLGPITVEPSGQNGGIGRRLMEALLERAAQRRFPGVRLVQAAYHHRPSRCMRSLALRSASRWRGCRGPRSG